MERQERITKLAEGLGWQYYIGANTGLVRVVRNKVHSYFDPLVNIKDCFAMVEEITSWGVEFYLFYKAPTQFNVGFGQVGWIAEIRVVNQSGKAIRHFRDMNSNEKDAICNVMESYLKEK